MTAPVPAGAPDIPDDVIERLAGLFVSNVRMPHSMEAWTDDERAAYDAGRSFTDGARAATRIRAAGLARAVLAYLRAHPEDAAAALGVTHAVEARIDTATGATVRVDVLRWPVTP